MELPGIAAVEEVVHALPFGLGGTTCARETLSFFPLSSEYGKYKTVKARFWPATLPSPSPPATRPKEFISRAVVTHVRDWVGFEGNGGIDTEACGARPRRYRFRAKRGQPRRLNFGLVRCRVGRVGSVLFGVWLIDFVYHSTLGLRVIKKKVWS